MTANVPRQNRRFAPAVLIVNLNTPRSFPGIRFAAGTGFLGVSPVSALMARNLRSELTHSTSELHNCSVYLLFKSASARGSSEKNLKCWSNLALRYDVLEALYLVQ